MSTDLHQRIAAAVVEKRRLVAAHPRLSDAVREFILAACDHADDVLTQHPRDHRCGCEFCASFKGDCPEIRALAKMWLGKGSVQ